MRLRHLLAGLGALALSPVAALGSWTPAVTISSPDTAASSSPDAALAPRGQALVAWLRSAPSGGAASARVEVATKDGASARWGRVRVLSRGGAAMPRVALDADGGAVVAWVNERAIVVAVRRHPSSRWSPVRAAVAGGVVQDLRVAIEGDGRPTVMWSERRGDGFLVRLASGGRSGSGWSVRPAQLATPGLLPPALALSSGAGALVAWIEDGRARTSRTADGLFETSEDVSAEESASPDAALSPRGLALSAWRVSLPGGTSVVQAADRATASGEWGSAEDLGIGDGPRAALNDRGDAVIVWSFGGPGSPQGIAAATRGRGRGWQATTVVARRACECIVRPGRPAIDGSGAVIVGWHRLENTGRGIAGAAVGHAGRSSWARAPVRPGRTREAPVVAAGSVDGGIAAWAEAGAGGGVRASLLRPG